jgi:uncharacterized protein
MFRCFLFSFLICCCLPTAQAQPEVPPLTGRVVDLADILSPQTEQLLTDLLAKQEEQTGNQIAVLTIPSLQGAVLEEYSIRVARAWALGTAQNDNGVLLLVAVEDRLMRIEVGLGLEGTLTDAGAGRIIANELRPRFRDGDFDGGVTAGVQAIVGVIDGTYTPPETSEEMPSFWFGLAFLLVPSLFAVIGIVLPGFARWFLFLFLMPFFYVGGSALTGSWTLGFVVLGVYVVLFLAASFHPKMRAVQKKLDSGKKARIGPFTVSPGSSGGGGWSSGGSSGGFSGGGGSFGGGGASGGW